MNRFSKSNWSVGRPNKNIVVKAQANVAFNALVQALGKPHTMVEHGSTDYQLWWPANDVWGVQVTLKPDGLRVENHLHVTYKDQNGNSQEFEGVYGFSEFFYYDQLEEAIDMAKNELNDLKNEPAPPDTDLQELVGSSYEG